MLQVCTSVRKHSLASVASAMYAAGAGVASLENRYVAFMSSRLCQPALWCKQPCASSEQLAASLCLLEANWASLSIANIRLALTVPFNHVQRFKLSSLSTCASAAPTQLLITVMISALIITLQHTCLLHAKVGAVDALSPCGNQLLEA